jgi:hypothetical protein
MPGSVTEPPRWASLKTAAIYSGLAQQTLRRYASQGVLTLRHVRLEGKTKGKTFLDLCEIDRFFESASAIPSVIAALSSPSSHNKNPK